VACCAAYDAVLSGEPPGPPREVPVRGLRLLVPRGALLEDLAPEVGRAFGAALKAIAAAGALVEERAVPEFDRQPEYFRNGGFAGAEAYAIHRRWESRFGEYDPRVAKRVLFGKEIRAADYVELGLLRAGYIRAVEALAAPYDALLMPTSPCVAPTIAEADASDDAYFQWNARILRNVGVVNFLDGCAVSVPCHAPGAAPVGVSVFGPAMADRRVLAVAAAIEGALGQGA
jgi:aspartyl-tRNA(Asn)/glutamyl-tRNA(Gln) amidotransferase subunit A